MCRFQRHMLRYVKSQSSWVFFKSNSKSEVYQLYRNIEILYILDNMHTFEVLVTLIEISSRNTY